MALTHTLVAVDGDGQDRVCGYVVSSPKDEQKEEYLLAVPDDPRFLDQLNSTLPPQTGTDHLSVHNMPSSTGYPSATEPATSPPPQSFSPPPNNLQLPSNVEYPGPYDFQINLGQPTSQAAKSVSWTYSPTLKKLFVDRDKPCPIQFKTTAAPPANCYIRVLPIFKQAENLAEVVSRCPNHVGPPDENSSNHLVLCSDPNTMYFTDQQSSRYSLLVPYTVPQVGTEFSKYLFTFKCFISCVGGLNRRKIQLVFTLESDTGSILGRQILDVRVCACPGRDRKSEEKSFEKNKAPQKKPLKRGPSKVTSVVGVTSFSKKAKKDEETFLIEVQGREKYEILMKIKESLDLMELVAPNQINQYRQQQTQQQMKLNNHLPNGVPNLPRVSSFQSTPPASTSQATTFNTALAVNNTPPPTNHASPPLLNHTNSYPQQQQQQAIQQPFRNLEPYPPSTSTGLARRDTMPCKDEADGPNAMDVDAIPCSQGFPVTRNLDLTPPTCQAQQNISPNQDPSIYSFLKRLGMKQHTDIFNQKGVHTVDQLDEINMEDLSSIPHQQRESLWKAILDIKSGLQLSHTQTMNRGSSCASTMSIHSSGGSAGGNQVYRATRFTLKQTLSFKVEKDDD
ncbi:cellular tumor antigen p53-like isoform X1 [Lytechinus pictus]|uniref:cellular tumor antigen p53-like isoform X1 n=2 Tax=Lytechinus pictus TaxID=7653 RepID=UPI0030B9C8AD